MGAEIDTDPFLNAAMLTYDHARLVEAEELLRKVALVGMHEGLKRRLSDATGYVSELSREIAEHLADLAELRRIVVAEEAAAKRDEPGTLAEAIDQMADGLDKVTAVEAVVRLTRKVTSCDETADLVREALAPWEEEQSE